VYDKLVTTAPTSLSANATLTTDAKTGTEPLTLASGGMLEIYIDNPTGVSINDIGTTIGITVFTAQAMYYQETNVQATTTTLPTT
jgi:hypothetical protein